MKSHHSMVEIPNATLENWQDIIDILADVNNIPSALVMRISGTDLEVLLSSQSKDNPYHPGDKEHHLNSGLYCETVINSKQKLLVPNALEDENWKNNPDVKLNMISYLGFPILLPNGHPFGTLCLLDNKENSYSATIEQLMLKFKELIEGHIELLHVNQQLGDENKRLIDYFSEVKALRGIIPLCSFCKKIRDDEGYWEQVDVYINKHSEANISHSLCPDCVKEHYPGVYEQFEKNKMGE
jgi:transcriptional regulator with GAF, ATPase, and Fis domain